MQCMDNAVAFCDSENCSFESHLFSNTNDSSFKADFCGILHKDLT